jgi:alkanesulfonate monooxygenase SsuD/methylene tetrahydromethanopterin reductase-like flavin-dependent oxidoreductase (luciferase family)
MVNIGAMIRRDVPPERMVAQAIAIESHFDELWVVEDLPFAGGISAAATVLAATDSSMVGHGIAPAPFRNPAVLAMEWAMLARLYPGRFIGGLGHGVQRWMEQIGARVDSPLTLLEETIAAVHRLLTGESVTVHGRYVRLDGVRLEFPPPTVPKVLAGVSGPKSLVLSGAVADGTLISEGHGPAEIARARELTDRGRARAGRSDPDHFTVFAGFYVGEPDGLAEPNPDAPKGWDAVGDEPGTVAARLQTLIEAGVDSIVLVPLGTDAEQQLQLAATEVVPQLVR